MTLHPDLAKLLPKEFGDTYPYALTEFALAVARQERERIAAVVQVLGFNNLARTTIRALPDPDWTVTP